MYSYSAAFHLPGDKRCACDFRASTFANVLASYLIVWHRDAQGFIQQHPQERAQVKAIGPLMAGDESVVELPPDILRARAGIIPSGRRHGLQYVSVFDVAPKVRDLKIFAGIYPSIYTEEYMYLFLRDMYRLLQDLGNIVLVFKPQRSLRDASLSYSNEFREVVHSINQSERGFVLDDAINSWVPIAVADLCIAVPFTVPPLSGMHYGIPGLFHDPTGFVHNHRYKAIPHCITHSYDQLRSEVRSLLLDSSRRNGRKEAIWSEAREFIGECPGTNSSDRFRKFLVELRN
jgi:polysaccharide biosynthesis PFTS motif protein